MKLNCFQIQFHAVILNRADFAQTRELCAVGPDSLAEHLLSRRGGKLGIIINSILFLVFHYRDAAAFPCDLLDLVGGCKRCRGRVWRSRGRRPNGAGCPIRAGPEGVGTPCDDDPLRPCAAGRRGELNIQSHIGTAFFSKKKPHPLNFDTATTNL